VPGLAGLLQRPERRAALREFSRCITAAISTNTLPRWPAAQPMRLPGPNGEINTLLGNPQLGPQAAESHLDAAWGAAAADLSPLLNAP